MGPSRPFVQTEGREPKAGNQIGCRVPDIRNPVPYCPTALLPYCSVKIWMQDTGCTMQDKNGSDSAYLVPGTWYLAPFPHFKS
jgi:hypothetical protein